MNCIDFRREAMAQPLRLEPEASSHANGCAACREFLERQRQFDADLFDALQVPVPDGLAERIVLAGGMRRARRPWLWAAAASLVAATGIALVAAPYVAGNALAHEAIEHVKEEPQSFRLVSKFPAELLASELAVQGIRLVATLGEVTYSQLCPMASGMARHIVLATADGPVTLFLLPTDATSRRRAQVNAEGMTAITLPARSGSITIVAADRQRAAAIAQLLVTT